MRCHPSRIETKAEKTRKTQSHRTTTCSLKKYLTLREQVQYWSCEENEVAFSCTTILPSSSERMPSQQLCEHRALRLRLSEQENGQNKYVGAMQRSAVEYTKKTQDGTVQYTSSTLEYSIVQYSTVKCGTVTCTSD